MEKDRHEKLLRENIRSATKNLMKRLLKTLTLSFPPYLRNLVSVTGLKPWVNNKHL